MKYFSINFENFMSFIVMAPASSDITEIARLLNYHNFIRGHDDYLYNSRRFVSVNPIDNPSERDKLRARHIHEVLV